MEKRIKQRIFGYDLLKALAMFMVVFYHIANIDLGECMIDGHYFLTFSKYLYGILSASVPLFFMVNGALIRDKVLSIRWCLTKSLRLFGIACIWTIIFRCGVLPLWFNRAQVSSLSEFKDFYWFLFTLAELYPITWLFQRSHIVRNISLGCLVICPFISNFVWDCIFLISPETELPSWGHTGMLTMYSIVYYYLGQLLSKVPKSTSIRSIIISILCIVVGTLLVLFEVYVMSNHTHKLYDGVNACFPTIGALFITVGLFVLIKDLNARSSIVKTLLSDIGSNTIGIYIFHSFLIACFTKYAHHGDAMHPVWVMLEAMIIVVASAYISKAILKSSCKFLLRL